ncbi:hypothetical protein Ocin01_18451 [Orchesella cincta]|uniref:Uncharacterized protein n=1 Tax=Orchesella cincta TaxID=48709 RepID=A0A1D2M5G7_ORCCI|nr:hypothetical protein Ocin01_18451 [Orchesella cincta]
MEAKTGGKLRMSSPTTTVDASDAFESSVVELDALVVNAREKERRKESTKTRKKAKLEKERSKCDAAKLNSKEEAGPIITRDGDELYLVEKILSKEVARTLPGAISKLGRCPELLLAFEKLFDDEAKKPLRSPGTI